VELFFQVNAQGKPKLGHDPEMAGQPMLTELKFMPIPQILAMPTTHRHGIFRLIREPAQLLQLRGFFTLPDM
jgi:hypothetical protein